MNKTAQIPPTTSPLSRLKQAMIRNLNKEALALPEAAGVSMFLN